MSNNLFYNPIPRFADENNDPIDNGRVQFFEAGTVNLIDLYADSTEDTPITNPVVIESGGYLRAGGVWVPPQTYDISVEKFNGYDVFGVPQYTVVRQQSGIVSGALGGGGIGGSFVVDSISALRALLPASYESVYVLGYYGVNTRGGKLYTWNGGATANDDGGFYISPNGAPATGRWQATFVDNQLTPYDFGSRTGVAYSNASNFENMIAFVQANSGYEIVLPSGDWYLNGNVDFSGNISVIVKSGFRGRGLTGAHTLTFSCETLIIEGIEPLAEQVPSNLLSLVITSKIDVFPQWFEAVPNLVENSQVQFDNCIAQSGTNNIVINAPFLINDHDFTGRTLIKEGTDGLLKINGTPIIFDKIIADGQFIIGVYSNMTFLNYELEGDWFDFFNGVDVVNWGKFIDSLASNGQHQVNWSSGVVEFFDNYTSSLESINKVYFNISSFCKFKVTGVDVFVALPKIISLSHCIDNTSTGRFYFGLRTLDATVYLSQFGAVVGDYTSVAPALLYAMKTGATIDLNGENYETSLSIDATILGISESKIQNGGIEAKIGFTPTFVIKSSDNLTIDNVRFYCPIASKNIIWLSGSNKTINIRNSNFNGLSTTRHIYDAGTLNTVDLKNNKHYTGLLHFATRLNSLDIIGSNFDETYMLIVDPADVLINSNTFIMDTNAIFLSIPVGQTAQRNGFIITDNKVISLYRDIFINLSDGNSNFGMNYHAVVENNLGTDISTTYEFRRLIDLSLGNGADVLTSSEFNISAMRNSGFFVSTQFNWGSLATQATSAYISNVEGEYIDSDSVSVTIQYYVQNSSGAGSAWITGSFRRTL